MAQHRHIDLSQGPVVGHILRMTPPMMVAFLAMMSFNLADAWFVSRLGTRPLAAMGFTFPVVMLVFALSFGLGLGTSACVSGAIGRGDHDRVQHLATYSILLAFLVNLVLAVAGWLSMRTLFNILGADSDTLDMTLAYMRIWFSFAPLVTLPMVMNNAIRATGDTLRPSIIMCTAALINVVLDPLFIFGLGPFPAMGIKGAALATGLARMVTVVWALWLIHHRCRLLTLRWEGWGTLFSCWRELLHVAIPASATNVLMPLTLGIITRLVAHYGVAAVAATTAGQRIERFVYIIPMAMGTTLMPIIGQNWGAGRADRVRKAWATVNWLGVGYSIVCLAIAVPLAPHIASWFSRLPEVQELITRYLWILLTGAVLLHVTVHTGFAFNAIKKPFHASLLTIIRLAGLVIPLAWLGSRLFGVTGVYAGIALAHICTGLISLLWFRHVIGAHTTPS